LSNADLCGNDVQQIKILLNSPYTQINRYF